MKHGLICLVFLIALPPLYAQQVGDTVIMVAPSEAKLKMENRVVGVIPRGASLKIEEANKSGYQVLWKGTSGWIAKEDVLSPDDAIKSFDRAIKKKPQACDYCGRGNAWYEKKCYDKAIDDYNEAIRLDPKGATPRLRCGGAWMYQNEYDKALADYAEAVRMHPENSEAYCGRGNAWCGKGDYKTAIADYSKAIRLDAKNAAAYSGRGFAYYSKGSYDPAIADCTEAIRLDPKLCDAYCYRGAAWHAKGNFDKAIADANEAIRLDAGRADAFGGRGASYMGKGDLDRAIADYTEAIRLDPKGATPRLRRGDAWMYQNEYDKALADYAEAVRMHPENSEAYCGRGNAWCGKGDYKTAIADYSEAIRLDAKNAAAYCGRGFACYSKGSYDPAIADCTEAIRLYPKLCDAYCYRGAAWHAKGNFDKAIADANEALRIDAGRADAFGNRGDSYMGKGDLDKAIADYSEAIRLDPKYTEVYSNRASAYRQRGDFHRAVADYTEVIRNEPENGDAYFDRGAVRHAQGDYKRAIADYTEAIRRGVKNVATYSSRGDVSYEKGDTTMAIEDYTAAIALSPKSPCLYEIRAKFLIARGDYDLGMRDIETAIRLNPKDQAAKFEAWPKTPLSAEALRHGERQVRQMLKDREAMGEHGELADPLYEWAIRKFAGEDLGEEVFWNAADQAPRFNGCNHPPTDNEPGWINVREIDDQELEIGKKLSFEKAWVVAVFELYNIASAKDFDQLERQASSGEISKDQFAAKRTEIESRAAEKARSFYIHVFLPWAKRHHVATNSQSWFLGTRCDPEAPLLGDIDKTDAYWQGHERAYESLVARAKTEKSKTVVAPKDLPEQAATKQQKPAAGGGGVAASATKPRAATEPPAKAKGIEPLDVLTIWANGTLLDQPVRGRFLVEPSGKVLLGPAYGRVEVKGLTIEEAEKAIKKKLDEILRAPEVEVLAAGHASRWPGETPTPSFRIGPGCLLKIRAINTLLDQPIDGDYRVDASGKVQFAEPYGSVTIKGLTLEEAEQAITKELRKVLDNPQVSVSLTGWKRGPKGSGSR
jgi:tetratricopeptide (TPR) repeat protein/protein involved in polysaccharide export with SLBB domain